MDEQPRLIRDAISTSSFLPLSRKLTGQLLHAVKSPASAADGWVAVFIRCHSHAMPRAVRDDTCALCSLPPPEFRSAGRLSWRSQQILRHRTDNNSTVGSPGRQPPIPCARSASPTCEDPR
ncbi:hypothetical protein MRX96_032541 [Rhipicephalus microplus]